MGANSLNSQQNPRRFVFLLLDNFSLISFSSAIDALRLANQESQQHLYNWIVASPDGKPSMCSANVTVNVDQGLEDTHREDTIVVCGGLEIQAATTKPVLNWLRKEARRGVVLAGLCTAAFTLAKAGLFNEKRATIHWENQDSFAEEFDTIELTRSVFVVDGKRLTSAGGTSSIDLMLKIIADDHGEALASEVADQLIYNSIRTDSDVQRLSIPTRIGVRHPKLSAVVKMMEINIEEPISPSILARDVGMSTRQLERLFRRYINKSPKRYYMELRLVKARNLLMQTDMSVINVALACGFASPSHFSKCYRAQYKITPYRERGAQGSSVELKP